MSRPSIVVNTRLLLPGKMEGISRFAHEVLCRMVGSHPEVDFTFVFDRAYDPVYCYASNVKAVVLSPQARHPLLWQVWFHYQIPRLLRRLRPNVFFSPEFYLSAPTSVPQVAVFHDIAFAHYPEDYDRWAGKFCRKYAPIYADRAASIITVSEYGKQDLVQTYGTQEDKIEVVYNGVSDSFKPVSPEERALIREKYTQGDPYFLFVGTLQPRKNIETLLQAFERFKSEHPSTLRLLIVGKKGWKYQAAEQTYLLMQHREDVHFTGFVSDEELSAIYASAFALCYIPYFEGFGLPLLEAMKSDLPIICSNTSSLPEVVGEAALSVDPCDPIAIAAAMNTIWEDVALRNALIIKGRERSKLFSWDRTAEGVWNVLERYLE